MPYNNFNIGESNINVPDVESESINNEHRLGISNCPYCNKNNINNFTHVIKCYIISCLNEGVQPLCTCSKCRGQTPHFEYLYKLEDNITQLNASKFNNQNQISSLTSQTILNNNNSNYNNNNSNNSIYNNNNNDNNNNDQFSFTSPSQSQTSNNNSSFIDNNVDEFAIEQLIGEKCIYCSNSKSNRNKSVPFFFIGNYREFFVCQKSHLTKEITETNNVIKKLNNEIERIKNCGDNPINFNNEIMESKNINEKFEKCHGLKKINNNYIDCNNDCNQFIECNGKYFCSIIHLFNYLVKNLKTEKKRRTNNNNNNNNKQQKNNNNQSYSNYNHNHNQFSNYKNSAQPSSNYNSNNNNNNQSSNYHHDNNNQSSSYNVEEEDENNNLIDSLNGKY